MWTEWMHISSIRRAVSPYVPAFARQALHRIRGIEPSGLSPAQIPKLVGKPDPVILEIGCNNGEETIAILKELPLAKIFCFEPDPRAIAKFKKKLAGHPVELFELAISDRSGDIEFHCSNVEEYAVGWDLSGSIRKPKNHLTEHPKVKFEHTILVPTQRLDDWREASGIEYVDFIWMDVQGAESDVISGATSTLERTRFLYTEYSNRELYEGQPTLKTLLSQLPSFRLLTRYGTDVLLENIKAPRLGV